MNNLKLLLPLLLLAGFATVFTSVYPSNLLSEKLGSNGKCVVAGSTIPEDLPLRVMQSSVKSDLPMLVFITGDGGWNSFEESLCQSLNQKGVPVVVLDSQKYFWKSKTPEVTTIDLLSIIKTYQNIWKRNGIVLAGFSFGASILPFLVNRFPPEVKNLLVRSILISPNKTCDFEIHLSDMLNLGTSKGNYDVIKEIQTNNFNKLTAVFGSDESKEERQAFQKIGLKVEILTGNHHFNSGFEALANLIVAEMK